MKKKRERDKEHAIKSYLQGESITAIAIQTIKPRQIADGVLSSVAQLYSPVEKIRRSGLWLVNELHKTPLSKSQCDELRLLVTPNPVCSGLGPDLDNRKSCR